MRGSKSDQPLNTALKPPSEIAQTVTVGRPKLPGQQGPVDTEVRGAGSVSKTLRANPRDEYVSAGGYVWLARYIKALPWYIDDLSRDFGDDIYERMMLDAQVSACINVRKAAVLADGMQIIPVKDIEIPSPTAKKKPGKVSAAFAWLVERFKVKFAQVGEPSAKTVKAASALSEEIAEFCRWNLEHLQLRPFLGRSGVMWEMLDSFALGHKMAEQVYEIPDSGKYAGMLTLKALKVKPRRSTAFVVDVYFNTLGIIGLIPGQGAPVIVESIIGEPGQIPNILPRDKFAVYSHQLQNGDPRGTADLRTVYEPWWFKRQAWGEYLKFLTVFGGGMLIGTTAENANNVQAVDADGNPTGSSITPEQNMLSALQQLQAGGAAAFPHGSTVEQFLHDGTNSPYDRAIDVCDRQIAKGLLGQTLATEEGEHQTRASSGTHQDILGLFIRSDKEEAANFIRYEILRLLVEYNYGTDAARDLTPIVALGETESQDFATTATAVSALQTSGFLHWTQMQGIDEMLGLPARDMDAVMADRENDQALAKVAATTPKGPSPNE